MMDEMPAMDEAMSAFNELPAMDEAMPMPVSGICGAIFHNVNSQGVSVAYKANVPVPIFLRRRPGLMDARQALAAIRMGLVRHFCTASLTLVRLSSVPKACVPGIVFSTILRAKSHSKARDPISTPSPRQL